MEFGESFDMKKSFFVKLFLLIEIITVLLLGIYYFACRDTLYYREADGNIEDFGFSNDVGELIKGRKVEQIFVAEMDEIDDVKVMLSNYGKETDTQITVTCFNISRDEELGKVSYKLKELGTYDYVDVPIQKPQGLVSGDVLKLTITSEGSYGDAPTVLYNAQEELKNKTNENVGLYIDDSLTKGTLSMTISGTDKVWTGEHFLFIMLGCCVGVAIIYLAIVWKYYKSGKSYFFSLFTLKEKYGFLLEQLVSREFKTRYKRSVLGILWSVLNPILMMSIQYIVFSQLFKTGIDNYPVYLLSGTVIFNFFNEAVGQAMISITGNASLISKVYLPKYIYPITKVISSGINLLLSLVPLFIVILMTGEEITKTYIMIPYILFCVFLFTVGFGMMMASAMTFFRDMGFLWGIIIMAWTYLTPLFYPVSIIPEPMLKFYNLNPMVHFINSVRAIVIDATAPRPSELVICTAWAVVMMLIGSYIFKRSQDKFIFYV